MSRLGILAQRATSLPRRIGAGRAAAVLALMAIGVVAAFGFAPGTLAPEVATHFVVRDLALPALAPAASGDGYWREARIERGDTLGSVLARLAVNDPAAQQFLRSAAGARPLYQLTPGKSVRVETSDDGRLMSLRYLAQGGAMLAVERNGDGFVAAGAPPAYAVHTELRAGQISSSLFGAADEVGLPDAVTMQLAQVFSGDIDFYHDLRRGDRFAVVYEMRDIDGVPAAAGKLVAAEFVNKGTSYRAFLRRAPDGSEAYYTDDGRNLRKAFLRSPVEFTRITSGFTMARFHPFLHTWRAHKGVDFAAPMGTPVHATADGRVSFAGRQNGYGNVVMLHHAGANSTVYAHLSRFAAGMRPGAHVSQGEVIGYVGQTGWATGPHLHYEFRVDNVQRNPMTIALPDAPPLAAADRPAYLAAIAPLVDQLALGRLMTIAAGD
ncbi:MAG TPA: peptidoglycan DD-metalloendopeptidase family protein [Casimicrobiaceae bacterium]|nr:peptidoglycan DD-metalloendopeptidase family protein [Casimicrobiaceae bacterium]